MRVGSQTPRVANFPPYDLSAAEEVIELADSAGLELDEWQRYVLTHGLGHDLDEEWTARKVSVWVPRQNGKGGIIEALELAWLFHFGEEEIIHSAHQDRTAEKAFDRLEKIIRGARHLHKRVRQYRQANGQRRIELHDGRQLQYVTRSRTAIRGFSSRKIVLDEAQELTGEEINAILPTVSAMPNWQVWFFGTPPDDPSAWVYALKDDGEAAVERMAHFDWGRDIDLEKEPHRVRDQEEWYAANPALGQRRSNGSGITIQTVEDECRPSGLGAGFPYERLGVWRRRAVAAGKVVDPEVWRSIADPDATHPPNVAFAVRVNPDRSKVFIGFAGRRDDGRYLVGLSDNRSVVHGTAERIVELRNRHNPAAIVVDAWSERLVLDLKKLGVNLSENVAEPKAGDLVIPTAADTAAAFAVLVDAINADELRHVDDPVLNTALLAANAKPRAGGRAWDGRSADAAAVEAVTLALWAFEARAHLLIEGDYDVTASVY